MTNFSIEEYGYNKSEVNKFIDDVIKNTELLLNKVHELEGEKKRLQDKEVELSNSLVKATEIAHTIKMNAFREREALIDSARFEGEKILEQARTQKEQIELKKLEIEKSLVLYKRKLEVLLKGHEELVKMLDDIKINE